MTSLRLPVEALRWPRPGKPDVWYVGDPTGRRGIAVRGDLRHAFEQLALQQQTARAEARALPDWPARIAQEKARWSERAFLDEVGLTTDIGDPAFASRYALSLAALAGTLPLAGQRRRGDEDAQDHALDVASAEAVRTYVQPERYVPLTLTKERQ